MSTKPRGAVGRLVMTPEEAAEALGVGRRMVFELLANGSLRSIKIGRYRRITPDALRDFLDDLEGTRHDRPARRQAGQRRGHRLPAGGRAMGGGRPRSPCRRWPCSSPGLRADPPGGVAKLTAMLRQAQQGIAAPTSGQSVAGYLATWLEDTGKRQLRPRTYETYELLIRRHIAPVIGSKRLDRLTAADVRRLLNVKADEGLSPSTVRQLHAVIRVALRQAVRDDLLPRNVAKLVQVPVALPEPVQPLDPEESRQLLDTARNDRLYALWAVAIGVGLRRGEALALRWSDVDLDTGVLRVEQAVQRVNGKLRFAPPKAARSRRTIPLPGVCVAALRLHKAKQSGERLVAGAAWHDSGLVFTTSIGTPIEPRNLNRSFDALCARAGVHRIRIHDLRHTCASLLLAQNVAPRVVMEVLATHRSPSR